MIQFKCSIHTLALQETLSQRPYALFGKDVVFVVVFFFTPLAIFFFAAFLLVVFFAVAAFAPSPGRLGGDAIAGSFSLRVAVSGR